MQRDLTTGSITKHLLTTMSFMLVTMLFQTLYFLIDLYWVGRLGTKAVAAVGIVGNLTFVVLALTQMLGVGTTAMVAHAAGRKDQAEAVLIFNQSQVMALVTGALFLVAGMAGRWTYAIAMSADAETAALTEDYLAWFVPAMALQFAMVAMGSALRATGNFKTGTIVGTVTVILNMILAPVLIFGWGTGHPLGVAGAAISSLIAIVVGNVWLAAYFLRPHGYLRFKTADWKPRFDLWKRMLAIGLPAGFEFAVTAAYLAIVYSVTRRFGAAAQAAFGIGMRIFQAGFMPVVALGFSVAPVAGQNFGARQAHRVVHTFRDAAWLAGAAMIAFMMACQVAPASMVGVFSDDADVIRLGAEYLRIASWGSAASGLIFVASSMFQAMGNTMPSLISSALRIAAVTALLLIVAPMPDFELRWIWLLSVAAVFGQFVLSMALLRREFARRLNWDPVVTPTTA